MSTPATFGHMNEIGRELMAQPELHSCPRCDEEEPRDVEGVCFIPEETDGAD